MNKSLIATLVTLLWLLLPASLPAALAQDEKLDLPPVHNVDFTADDTLGWDAPTEVAQEHFLGFNLFVRYLTRDSSGNDYVYTFSRKLAASATSTTLSYDTSRGSFHCAVAGIQIDATATHYNDGTVSWARRGPCTNWNWGYAIRGNENDGGDQVALSIFNGVSPPADSPASRERPSLRDGVMLSLDGRLNPHSAAPVAAYAGDGGLNFWHVLANSEGIAIGSIPDVNALTQAGRAGGELLRASHPESGKTITVTWRPQFQVLEVSTFYADTEHQANKLYTFCIMPDNHVEIVLW